MVRRVLVRGVAAAFVMLVPGTAWSEPAAGPAHLGEAPSSEVSFPVGSSPQRILGGRSEDLRGWARDKRIPTGDELTGALLAGVAVALLAGTERVVGRRTRGPTPWTVRTMGARSPPLQTA